jgi:predicted ABC-type ATPase
LVRELIVLGGPNRAGKTTAAETLVPELAIAEFVNADEIAGRLRGWPIDAGADANAGIGHRRLRDRDHMFWPGPCQVLARL